MSDTAKTLEDHAVTASERIPTIHNLEEPESDEVTVFIDTDEPSEAELLRLYETYLDGGGEPYEPFESMRVAAENGDEASEN